ncbi:hypothetical protein [Actinomadura sediminis]|uniref:Uncharacterized protein n=1 Tax=Actinomadura sediminis TaxID=1038904 RepID=A0ABW3F0S3_9ACTN
MITSDQLDQVCGRLVNRSWARFSEGLKAREVDDLLVGAVIAAAVAQGNALVDLASGGSATPSSITSSTRSTRRRGRSSP